MKHGGTGRETSSKRVREKLGGGAGSAGQEISESDSLNEDRINRVHEVSEEVTWLLSREQLPLVICLLLSRLRAVPFVVPARVHGLNPVEPKEACPPKISEEKETERGGESERDGEGGSGDNSSKGAVTFDSSCLVHDALCQMLS